MLLDTNVMLFWLTNSPRISRKLKEVVEQPRNTIFFSPLSVWEYRIKAARQNIDSGWDLVGALSGKEFHELSFTSAHADGIKVLPLIHHDPFDRGLIAQARCERMCLVTSDALLARYDVEILVV